MAALTNIYVDPSLADDVGDGLIDTPFGDLEYAIEQVTHDTTNGTRVNIKAGTDEVLVADIATAMADTSVSVAWAPASSSPVVFQGYTAIAEDAGIGGISGGGSVSVYSNVVFDYVHFIDLHCHNSGAAIILDMDNNCSVVRCEVNNTSSDGINVDLNSLIMSNYVHDCGGSCIEINNGWCFANIVESGEETNDCVVGINVTGTAATERNIVSVDGASIGIHVATGIINCNSVWSNAGTGIGIRIQNNQDSRAITNNLIEGFSGVGGDGIEGAGSLSRVISTGGNAVYNCTTAYGTNFDYNGHVNLGDNETLSASPFTDAANGDFSPVDTGNVKEGALPAGYTN